VNTSDNNQYYSRSKENISGQLKVNHRESLNNITECGKASLQELSEAAMDRKS